MLNPAAGAIRGAGAVLKRITAKGDALRLVGDALLLVSPGGRPHPNVRDAVALARPLLVPYLRDGQPPACGLGCGAEAATVAYLEVPWCGDLPAMRRPTSPPITLAAALGPDGMAELARLKARGPPIVGDRAGRRPRSVTTDGCAPSRIGSLAGKPRDGLHRRVHNDALFFRGRTDA